MEDIEGAKNTQNQTDGKEQVTNQRIEDIEEVSGQRREGRRQGTADRRKKIEDREQRTEKGEWRTDNIGQGTYNNIIDRNQDGGQKTDDREHRSENRKQRTVDKGPKIKNTE